jgi:hypothetical protein
MAAMDEMLKRRPLRKTQSFNGEIGQSFAFSPTSAVTDKLRNHSIEGNSPGLKRKTKSIEQKEHRGSDGGKSKAMDDHSDMLFVTALEVNHLLSLFLFPSLHIVQFVTIYILFISAWIWHLSAKHLEDCFRRIEMQRKHR